MLKESKVNSINLQVETKNSNALNLYKSCGFKENYTMGLLYIKNSGDGPLCPTLTRVMRGRGTVIKCPWRSIPVDITCGHFDMKEVRMMMIEPRIKH